MRALPIDPEFAGPIILCCGWLSPADAESVHDVFMLDASYQKKGMFLDLRQPFKAILSVSERKASAELEVERGE
jgi:hypothetical protein